MERSEVAIIIPAFNEADTIEAVVKGVLPYGLAIVVNDCSNDATAQLAKQAGSLVVNHEYNQGYDAALNSGFQKASELGALYAITFDADGQHCSELLRQYIEYLRQGYDLVLGVRPKSVRIGEKLFSIVTNLLYSVKDPLCGMKGYNLKLYEKHGIFDSFNSIGTELAINSIRDRCSFVQLAVPISVRKEKSRFGNHFAANLKIFMAMIILVFKNNATRYFRSNLHEKC